METAKRAVEIAAAGGHNLLLVGPPGAGKSMLASRLPGLLPDLTPAEALEVSTIHSVAGMLIGGLMVKRPPYREPHHSASPAALTGGGQRAKPGEVSLAHRGVLFLDELPEFPRPALEALRTPLETGRTTVARAAAHVTYPARFQLVAAMNPCRCGHLGDAGARVRQGPALRRGLPRPHQRPAAGPHRHDGAGAADRPRRAQPRAGRGAERRGGRPRGGGAALQRARGALERRGGRPRMELQPDARALAEQAAEKLRLSARGFTRVLRVARTVADLARAGRCGGWTWRRRWRFGTGCRGGRFEAAGLCPAPHRRTVVLC